MGIPITGDTTPANSGTYAMALLQWEAASEEIADIAVAFLSDLPFDYFETNAHWVKAYGKWENIHSDIEIEVKSIAESQGWNLTWQRIERQNWNEEWEKNYFEPLTESGFYVRAPFHPETSDPHVEHTIVIQPRMSFGTGHHATTQLMLKYIWQYRHEIKGHRVLDMGTGTGILAIAAAQVGASEVLGVEIDDWVVDNAKDNLTVNQISQAKMVCGTVDALKAMADGYFPVVLANIHREVILADLQEYTRVLSEGGWMLLSGLQHADKMAVVVHANSLGMQLMNEDSRGEWICLQFLKS